MLKSLMIAVTLSLAALPAMAQESRGHLTMTGSAMLAAEPDITRVHGGLYIEGDSAEDARATAKARMARLRKTMESFGKVQVSRISLGQSNSSSKGLIGSSDPGFTAQGSITITLSDPEMAGRALDTLVKAGVDGIARLDHDIADRATLMTEARERAVADAVLRAETYARAANLDLGPIVDLSENRAETTNSAYQGPSKYDSRRYGAQGMAGGTPAITVVATVTIRWMIK